MADFTAEPESAHPSPRVSTGSISLRIRPEPEKEPGDFGALIVGPDAIDRVDWRYRVTSCPKSAYAVEGAHTEFLLGALRAGASAVDAVRYAIELGDSAGGEVHWETI